MVRWALVAVALMVLAGAGGCAVHVHKHVVIVALPGAVVSSAMNSETDASGNTADADASLEVPLIGG